MQIFIKELTDSDEKKEWTIIELQGDLQSKNQEESMSGKLIGDLFYDKKGSPILIIGHHILYGKSQALEKPFAVLEKCLENGTIEYKVKALIHKKLCFRERPKPIVCPKKLTM